MTIEQAINKAITGGYTEQKIIEIFKEFGPALLIHEIILDPQFWECLGKGMGWEDGVSESEWKSGKGKENWRGFWHSLIDHLIERGTIETYFERL